MAITRETRTVAPCPYGDGYGMTLREHYAGQAMQGLLLNFGSFGGDKAPVAALAVGYADALLAELAKAQP